MWLNLPQNKQENVTFELKRNKLEKLQSEEDDRNKKE